MHRLFILLLFAVCLNCKDTQNTPEVIDNSSWQATLETLKASDTSRDSLLLANYKDALKNYSNAPNAINSIWLGRRIAYTGAYEEAIKIYTKSIAEFPREARLYRHRGHRYISIRQFDKAISDFNMAVRLIRDSKDQIEPDGVPNHLNQPISTLHTNIWYHLGLAHYLKNELKKAKVAFTKCLKASSNDDNIVSASHWLYMIERRLDNNEEAKALLEPISKVMTIIENDAYHQLLLFYKGAISEDELKGNESMGSSEAVIYGLANWYHYNGNIHKAQTMYEELVKNGHPAGFGYIAAEADLKRLN